MTEEERTQEGWGRRFSQPALFFFIFNFIFFIFLPEAALFHLSLSSHSGTGFLTATATELDGFDLLWLKQTKNPTDLYSVDTSTFHATTKTLFFCESFFFNKCNGICVAGGVVFTH